ncbi:histidinol-phosphatase [Sporobolomyces salmoneus]|uniref:histidinol-phosphatase n=1 Tax=Sporobolomyces salmoneus TaxID=183962 RepID=UPI003178CB72
MTISHHSHSGEFCLHAKGSLVEVVEEAIRQGFTTFGLSEHVPRYKVEHLYPEEAHLTPQDLSSTFSRYLVEANRLKSLYSNQISLLVGLETEYIDASGLTKLEQLLETSSSSLDYIVGSVHHCDSLPIDFDQPRFDEVLSLQSGSNEHDRFSRLFCKYFDNQFELIYRLRPEVIGHFDLCRLYYPEKDFREFPEVWKKVERNIELAVSYGALFELNASAFRKGWETGYPGVEVFDAILAKGGRFTLSDDSHGPQAVGLHYDKAYAYLRDRQVKELWKLVPTGERGSGGGEAEFRRGTKAVRVEGRPWEDEWPRLFEERQKE